MARQRRGGWQADLRLPDGRRMRPQFKTEAQAEAWEASARAALEAGKPIPGTSSGRAGKRDLSTWGGLFEHTKRHVWADCKAGISLIRNGRAVVDFFGANTEVKDVTKADLEELCVHLTEVCGNSNATINRKMAAASRMLRLAVEEGVITGKVTIPRKREGPGRVRYLKAAEEALMLAHWAATSDTLNHNLTIFLIDTGARAFSEAGRLRWDDISARGATFWDTKGGRPRTVPLSSRARAACEAMREHNPVGPFHGITPFNIRSRWDRMKTLTGLHDVTPHVLRHTCASRFVMEGVDLLRVKEWLGHATVQTTMRYAHLAPHALDTMAQMLDRREITDTPNTAIPTPTK